jgi:fumarate reductase subunit D
MKAKIDKIMIRINHNKSQKNHHSLILLNQEGFCVCVFVPVPISVDVEGGVLFPFGLFMAECKVAKVEAFVKENNRIVKNIFFIYVVKIKDQRLKTKD